jgi:hypothetical protein
VGGALGAGSSYLGGKAADWIKNRAAQPLEGWSQETGTEAIAEQAGLPNLGPKALNDFYKRASGVYQAVGNPEVGVQMGAATREAILVAKREAGTEAGAALLENADVKELMRASGLGAGASRQPGMMNAQDLVELSKSLGQSARQQIASTAGSDTLGIALGHVKEHVDDLITGTITDPAVGAAWNTIRSQYRLVSQATANPTIYNAATGQVNLPAFGKLLQRTDRAGYMRGGNVSQAYQAARYGQATGEGSGRPEGFWGSIADFVMKNPVTQTTLGAGAKTLAPVAPYIPAAATAAGIGGGAQLGSRLQQNAYGTTPVPVPYLEQ